MSKIHNDLHVIIEGHIQDTGGIIFGGYLRDKILKEHNSKLFYKEEGAKQELFYNPEHLPELFDRMIIPNDIDCIMSMKQFDDFKDILKREKFALSDSNESSRNNHWNIDDTLLTKKSFTVRFDVNSHIENLFSQWKVYVDISVYEGDVVAYPTYCDLACNSLIMSNRQVFLNPNSCKGFSITESVELLNDIINGIKEKKTKIASNISLDKEDQLADRALSMCMANNFRVTNENFSMVYRKSVNDDNTCYICHELVERSFEVKRTCCNGVTHAFCLTKLKEKSKNFYSCPHCRNVCEASDTDCIFMY